MLVYAILVDGERRYIGVSTGSRFKAQVTTVNRIQERRLVKDPNPIQQRLILARKTGSKISIEIVAGNLSVDDALAKERTLISELRDRVWNLNPGGDHPSSLGYRGHKDQLLLNNALKRLRKTTHRGFKQYNSYRSPLPKPFYAS